MKKLPVVQPRLFSFQCPENVGAMPEASGGHYCGRCEKVVLDLGEATLPEAVATIRGAKKGTCVSYGVATDGRLLFKDRSRGAVAITVAAFLAACHGQPADSAHDGASSSSVSSGMTRGEVEPPLGPIPVGVPEPADRLAGAPPVEPYEPVEPTSPPGKWPSASDEPPRDPAPPVAPPSPPRPTHPRPHLRGRVATPPPRPQPIAGEIPVPPPAPEPWSGTIAHPDD